MLFTFFSIICYKSFSVTIMTIPSPKERPGYSWSICLFILRKPLKLGERGAAAEGEGETDSPKEGLPTQGSIPGLRDHA